MKKDIDRLMQENNIDAILVTGRGQHNPFMVYMMGGGHLTNADLIKKINQPPVLFCETMERDEAAKSGFIVRGYSKYPRKDLMEKAGNNPLKARVIRYELMLKDLGINFGRIMLYGQTEGGHGYECFKELQKALPAIQFVGYLENDILIQSMATKDMEEVARIKRIGEITVGIVRRTADYLTSNTIIDNMLVDRFYKPVTIGMVKSRINIWLAEAGAENPEGTIFAMGADAGVPHSSGNDDDILQAGQPIVFDIFPCEAQGGYYYDFTRTWCLGYAPDDIQLLHKQVLTVYNKIVTSLKPGEPFKRYQDLTCELFEELGHPTINKNPATEEGYVHSIGHGLGLHVHESPTTAPSVNGRETLVPGSVFTIEPGLYYPLQGMGVRLEDSYWMNEDGVPIKFVDYPMDLVLPVKT